MTDQPDYVVLRPAPCIREEEVPAEVFGSWLDLASVPPADAVVATAAITPITPVGDTRDYKATPNSTFETNEFGLVAEVYLVHGPVHSCASGCG